MFKTGIGMQIGGGVDFALNENMSIEGGISYSQRGAKIDMTTDIGFGTVVTTGDVTLHYLDIPISFKYSVDAGPGKLMFAAGPKFGIGMSGKSKSTSKIDFMGTTQESTDETTLTFGSADTSSFKRIDLSIGTSVGYEISNLQFGASYYYGLTNHFNAPINKESMVQNMVTIFVAYKFGDN